MEFILISRGKNLSINWIALAVMAHAMFFHGVGRANGSNSAMTCIAKEESAIRSGSLVVSSDQPPRRFDGKELNGTKVWFLITEFIPSNGILKGFIEITNLTEKEMIFYVFNDIERHISICDVNGKILPSDTFMIRPGEIVSSRGESTINGIKLETNKVVREPFKINLLEHYDLKPHIKYLLRFTYDVRLCFEIGSPSPIKNWSEDYLRFVYTGAVIHRTNPMDP